MPFHPPVHLMHHSYCATLGHRLIPWRLILENYLVSRENQVQKTREKQALDNFFKKTCTCKCGPQKKTCSTQFSRDIVEQYRSNCYQLTSSQLNLVVMAQLSACRTHKDCIPSSYKGPASSIRPHTSLTLCVP